MFRINNNDFKILQKYKTFLMNLDNSLKNIPRKDIYFKDMRLKIEKYANENNMELVTIKKESGISKIPKDINGFIAIGSFSEK